MIRDTDINEKASAGPNTSPALVAVCVALGDILSDGIDVHRCLAAKALGRIGHPDAVPFLVKALLDEDEDVRTDSAAALAILADPASADQLIENLLGDPCSDVKLSAIDTLATLGDARVIPWLRRMVKGRDEEIAWDEEEFYDSGWDDWVEIQVRSIQALATMQAHEAASDIVGAVFDENAQDMTETAFKALAGMGADGITALAGFLGQPDMRLRRRAAKVLAGIDDVGAQELLALALEDPSKEIRLAALKARASKHPSDPALKGMMSDVDASVRAVATQLLAVHHPISLREAIFDKAPQVQAAALKVLSQTSEWTDGTIISELCQLLHRQDELVSPAAAKALVTTAPDLALDELALVLGDNESSATIRLAALQGLASLEGEQAVLELISAIEDENRQIRLEAISGLANAAKQSPQWPNAAGDALLAALQGKYDPEPEPETAEPEVTEQIAEEPAVEEEVEPDTSFPISTLDAMLADAPGLAPVAGLPEAGIELTPADMERLAIAKAVVGKKKIHVNAPVVQHDDIRRFAAKVLGDIPKPNVAAALAQALDHPDSETRLAAADGLARIGATGSALPAQVTQTLLDHLPTEDRALKLMLIRALAAGTGDETHEMLQVLLEDSDSFIRAEAIDALAASGWRGPELFDLVKDPDPSVRERASRVLAAGADSDDVTALVAFSFSFEGYHGRMTAALLRQENRDQANAAYLKALEDKDNKRIWSVAIEALDELNSQQAPIRGT